MNYRLSPGGAASALLGILSFVAYWMLQFGIVSIGGVWPIAFVIGVFVLAVTWSALDYFWFRGRHLRALQLFADHVDGWEYTPGTRAYAGRLRSFPFGVGQNSRDVDVVRGPYNGFACASFTHQYDEGKKEDEIGAPRSWQVDCVDLPYPLATIDILPDDVLAKFAKLLGGQDIDFESAAFNAEWRVKAGDRKYAHDVIHPRLMERLLWSDAKGLAIRIEGNAVYSWAVGRRGPGDLARRLGVLTAVARLIPEFVYREFQEVHDRLVEAQRQRTEKAPAWAKTPFALSGGRYTELGRSEYWKSALPEYADEDLEPPRQEGPSAGRGRWAAPPEDPHRTGRG